MECVLSPDNHAIKNKLPQKIAICKHVLHIVKTLPQRPKHKLDTQSKVVRIHNRVLGTCHHLNNVCSTGSRYCMLQFKYYGRESRKICSNKVDCNWYVETVIGPLRGIEMHVNWHGSTNWPDALLCYYYHHNLSFQLAAKKIGTVQDAKTTCFKVDDDKTDYSKEQNE